MSVFTRNFWPKLLYKMDSRDKFGRLQADPQRFPSGMKALADYVRLHLPSHLMYVGPVQSRVAGWYIFKPKNPYLGKFWRTLNWKRLVYFMAILSILRPNGLFYAHLVHFVVIWYILPSFGMLYREKSGNPGSKFSFDLPVVISASQLTPKASFI
jgi:hypothetical protein